MAWPFLEGRLDPLRMIIAHLGRFPISPEPFPHRLAIPAEDYHFAPSASMAARQTLLLSNHHSRIFEEKCCHCRNCINTRYLRDSCVALHAKRREPILHPGPQLPKPKQAELLIVSGVGHPALNAEPCQLRLGVSVGSTLALEAA